MYFAIFRTIVLLHEEINLKESCSPHFNFRRAIDSSPKLRTALLKCAFMSSMTYTFYTFLLSLENLWVLFYCSSEIFRLNHCLEFPFT